MRVWRGHESLLLKSVETRKYQNCKFSWEICDISQWKDCDYLNKIFGYQKIFESYQKMADFNKIFKWKNFSRDFCDDNNNNTVLELLIKSSFNLFV